MVESSGADARSPGCRVVWRDRQARREGSERRRAYTQGSSNLTRPATRKTKNKAEADVVAGGRRRRTTADVRSLLPLPPNPSPQPSTLYTVEYVGNSSGETTMSSYPRPSPSCPPSHPPRILTPRRSLHPSSRGLHLPRARNLSHLFLQEEAAQDRCALHEEGWRTKLRRGEEIGRAHV